jgi:hypothetical protein
MRKIKSFKLFESDDRNWRLSVEKKSKINKEINNVLIELIDNGFEIEIDHFAKKISEQNSILVSIGKNDGKTVFNTNEIKDNIEVLLEYMDENYGVKEYDYGLTIKNSRNSMLPGGKSKIDKEYPDNFEVLEIDIDIII